MRSWSSILGTALASLVLVVVPAGAQTTADVAVVDSAFQPSEVEVEAGGTVTWTQTGNLPHSVTADDGSFDSHPDCGSDCMGQGDTFQHTFSEPGTYAYHCKIHGGPGGVGMAGTVVVTAAAAPDEEPAPEPTADEPAAEPTSAPTEAPADESGGTAGDTAGDDEVLEVTEDAEEAGTLPETGAPTAALLVLALLAVAGGTVAARRPSDRTRD